MTLNKFLFVAFAFLCLSHNSHAQNIFRTVCQGNMNRLDSLLQHTSLDVKDDQDRTLLHWAVGCSQTEIMNFLIDQGIVIDSEDNQNRTPLHVAVMFNNSNAFEKLSGLQSDEKWVERYGISFLQSAILNKNEEMVRQLIDFDIDLNATNERGSTPLEIAQRIHADDISNILLAAGADEKKVRIYKLSGKYMGQPDPGLTPALFAPNFISTEESEFGSVFNASGTEFYFGVDVNGKNEIRYSALKDNMWTDPIIIQSHERYGYNDPFLSNDEQRLYFISKQAMDGKGELKDVDIWYVEKENGGWSEPVNAGPNINTSGNEYYISFTDSGTMYFSSNGNAPEERKESDYDIYYAEIENGEFLKPKALGNSINTTGYEADVFISPDESYIIFCSTRENGFGRGDLYISFKNPDNSWTEAINMGNKINTSNYEYCPFVSKDGKYLFYTSNQDIFWVSTEIIDHLKGQKK